MTGTAYRAKKGHLTLGYKKLRDEWENTTDDRRIYVNLYDMLDEALEEMKDKGIENTTILLGFNRIWNEYEHQMDEIRSRFEWKEESKETAGTATTGNEELDHLVKMFARQKGVWCDDLNRRLCQMAGLGKEYDQADSDTFEAVVYKAADILGVDIG